MPLKLLSPDTRGPYSRWWQAILTSLAMLAFAANSVLCRLAFSDTSIDPAGFTALRMLSAILVLWLVMHWRNRAIGAAGNWGSAAALLLYAAAFSFSYLSLSVATGALLLFGAVQITMVLSGLRHGERLAPRQVGGFVLAVAGLVFLLLPGLAAPPLGSAALMLLAGIAWGIYSLRGRAEIDPVAATAGNFYRTMLPALLLGVWSFQQGPLDLSGAGYALLSGALASAGGYILWYAVVGALSATAAATVQLSVPVLAAIAGIVLLAEPVTLRLVLASVAILGGIALVVIRRVPATG